MLMLEELFLQGLIFFMLAAVLPLAIAVIFGLIIGVLQAATQIQEQCSSFLLKLTVVTLVLFFLYPMLKERFTELCNLAAKLFITA